MNYGKMTDDELKALFMYLAIGAAAAQRCSGAKSLTYSVGTSKNPIPA